MPLGQAAADLVVTAAGTVPFLLVGLAVGWRIEGSALEAADALGLLPLFRFATTWVGMWCAVLLAVFAPLAVRRYARGER